MAEPDAADFLRICRLPGAWARQPAWRLLDTCFGNAARFLGVWEAWQQDPDRPALLHYVGLSQQALLPELLLGAAHQTPGRRALASALAEECQGLGPGFHRISLHHGQLLLTLCVGELQPLLRQQRFAADAIFLDPGPAGLVEGAPWNLYGIKALARLARRATRLALPANRPAWTDAALKQCGFVLDPGLELAAAGLAGAEFQPAWQLKSGPSTAAAAVPGAGASCAVVGAGLAGASVAAALARRGWQVQVLDAAELPACGASSLPVGLAVPHVSVDDCALSRLSRSGLRLLLAQAQALLRPGQDWHASGVLERGFEPDGPAADRWHAQACWVKPAALVQAWLAQPGVQFAGRSRVTSLRRQARHWDLLGDSGQLLASAQRVVLANAHALPALLQACRSAEPGLDIVEPPRALTAVHGQVSWALHGAQAGPGLDPFPPFPVNGAGSLLPWVPLAGSQAWYAGATYSAAQDPQPTEQQGHQANLARLTRLLPELGRQLAPLFAAQQVQAWRNTRCVSADRLPLLGPLSTGPDLGLWVCTAMGSRGLMFSVLCAELLAAMWGGEPLPVEARLASQLEALRGRQRPAQPEGAGALGVAGRPMPR